MSKTKHKRKTKAPIGRARRILPRTMANEYLAECSFSARILYLALNCYTDKTDTVKAPIPQFMTLCPFKPEPDVYDLLCELESATLIKLSGDTVQMLRVSEFFEIRKPSRNQALHSGNRRAAKRSAFPLWANRNAISEVYRHARERSEKDGEAWHVDHEIPLQHALVCGLHVHQNLKVVLAAENLSKSNKFEVAA